MKIKTTLKKLKRGDVVSIDWIDAGDLDDSPSSWFSEADLAIAKHKTTRKRKK